MAVNFADVEKAMTLICPFVHKTPVMTSATIDKMTGREVFFKCENLQKTGSFKIRGALNTVKNLKRQGHLKGVVTHSSGNHGQALAYAAHITDTPCTVVVPEGSIQSKMDAIRGYDAHLEFCAPNPQARKDTCNRIAREKDYVIVPPYDNLNVIAGQGTIGLELFEQVPDLDAVLVPTSGGGMVSGIAIAAHAQKKPAAIFCVEPRGKDLARSLKAGKWMWEGPSFFIDTIADGIRMQQPGKMNFEIMTELVQSDVFSVTDAQIIDAMKLVFQRMKLVIEPSSGAGVAALLSDQMDEFDPERKLKKVAVILCGGNLDIEQLPWTQSMTSSTM